MSDNNNSGTDQLSSKKWQGINLPTFALLGISAVIISSAALALPTGEKPLFKKADEALAFAYIPESVGYGELEQALAAPAIDAAAPTREYEAAAVIKTPTGTYVNTLMPAGMDSDAYTGLSATGKVVAWQNTNSDVVAWIKIPGTNINYPVVYHNDVNYYLNRGYYKEASHNGVIWANPGTSFSSGLATNTTLYGHNWTNISANPRIQGPGDVMFAQLTAYHHLSMAQRYPYIYFSTATEDMTFKIFAAFYTDLSFNYISPYPNVSSLVSEAKSRSRHSFDVDVDSSDKILTLSTCTRAYGRTANQRFVVMARKLRPGEGTSPYSISSNPNHKQPNVWG